MKCKRLLTQTFIDTSTDPLETKEFEKDQLSMQTKVYKTEMNLFSKRLKTFAFSLFLVWHVICFIKQ